MIIVLKQDAPDVQVREFCHELEGMGLQINDSKGSYTHILGLIGDTKAIAESWVLANPVVETCRRVSEPYKKANRKFHPDDSIIDVDGVKIGGGNFAVIAGPCSIESEEQITYCAQRVKAAGASLLRGGAFKPRTAPYSFQGMRSEGLDLLKLARRATGAPIVTEIMNTEHLPLFENVDLIQVGARNMQNFELLKAVAESWVLANPVVETCRRVTEPYKKANRKFHPDDSVIDVDGVKIGGGNFAVIAGPCSIESEDQITYCAQRVKAAGASLLRGGAFKPRTSPYSFQGMRSEGLDLLKLARRATGAPIVTEIMNTEHLPLFENVDLIQVGARNMQNFELLKAVGRQKKPVLLKRGLANTLEEFVMSAEYIMAEGNENVILCERGIRTFETSMRNTLDLAGVVMLHKMTHLPVVVDPSHACGHAWMVPELAKAAVAAGADGLMIEVHNNPAKAKCDGAQSLTPDQFDELMQFVSKEVEFFGKKMN